MCTALTLKTDDFYFGRNFDWEFSYGESVTVAPRRYAFEFSDSSVCDNHYAIIGTAFVQDNYPLYFDGTNEAGLSMAGLNFPGNACYNSPRAEAVNVASYELINRVLSRFATVSQALTFLEKVNITDICFNAGLPPSPLHWIIADCRSCYVIEPMSDGLRLHQNSFGVLTNNPPFDYHALNMSGYMQLTCDEPKNCFDPDISLSVYSRGMGALGLPGDWSSPSRFVRAAFERANSASAATGEESVGQFFHILGSVEHIRGCVKLPEDKYEITQYSSCCNTDKGVYYYTTYENRQICAVEMHKEKLDGNHLISYPMGNRQNIFYVN